ncbi:wD repeat domain, variant 2 [Homalodisca vitripennis]|nr:wD repeat domain, variant 2 [Homalodisca vitripennis]
MDGSKEHVLLGCCNDTTINLWTLGNIDSGKPAIMKTNFDVAWTDNHMPILVAPTYKSYVKKIIEKTNYEDLLIPDNGEINVCAISKCGKYTAIGSSNTQVYLHCDISGFIIKNIFKVNKCPSKLKVDKSRGNIFVVAGLDRSFKIWVCEEEFLTCPEEKAEVFSITLNDRLINCFILASEKLLTVTKNGTIKKWSLLTGQQIEELCVSRFDVIICDCDINCDNTVVTLDSSRKRLNVYFSDKSVQSLQLASHPSNCSFSADGLKLVVGFQNGYIQVCRKTSYTRFVQIISYLSLLNDYYVTPSEIRYGGGGNSLARSSPGNHCAPPSRILQTLNVYVGQSTKTID